MNLSESESGSQTQVYEAQAFHLDLEGQCVLVIYKFYILFFVLLAENCGINKPQERMNTWNTTKLKFNLNNVIFDRVKRAVLSQYNSLKMASALY